MNSEARFGKQLLQGTASSGETIKKRLLFIIPAVIFIIAGIFAMRNPDFIGIEESEMAMVLALFFGAGALFLAMAILFVKPAKAILYEDGYVLSRGSKVTEVSFSDVKGISDSTTAFLAYGIVPIVKTRYVVVIKNDGSRSGLVKAFVPDFNRFTDELGAAITAYLLRGVTKETIGKANITFGDKLELTGGRLVYDAGGKKGKIDIPLDSVRNVHIVLEGYWLYIEGDPDEKGKPAELAAVRADRAWNLDALYRILEMYMPKK